MTLGVLISLFISQLQRNGFMPYVAIWQIFTPPLTFWVLQVVAVQLSRWFHFVQQGHRAGQIEVILRVSIACFAFRALGIWALHWSNEEMREVIDTKQGSGPGDLLHERVARLTLLAARGVSRALQLRLQCENVSFGQWTFLRILWQEDGLSQRELSDRAHLTEPTTHTALIRMEELGFIIRRKVEGNKRRQHAFLTAKGWQLRDVLEPLALEVNDLVQVGLSMEDQNTLRNALLVMIHNLEKDERDAASRGIRVPPTKGNAAP